MVRTMHMVKIEISYNIKTSYGNLRSTNKFNSNNFLVDNFLMPTITIEGIRTRKDKYKSITQIFCNSK